MNKNKVKEKLRKRLGKVLKSAIKNTQDDHPDYAIDPRFQGSFAKRFVPILLSPGFLNMYKELIEELEE